MGTTLDLIITEGRTRGFGGVEGDFNRTGVAADKAEGRVGKLLTTLGKYSGGGLLAGGGGLAGMLGMAGSAALKGAGNVQAQTATLESLMKSSEKAAETMGYFRDQSKESAFDRNELTEAGTLLAAYGVDIRRFLPLADDLGAAFKSQGAKASDIARIFGRLSAGDFGEAFERLRDFGFSRKDFEAQGLEFDGGGSFQGTAEQALDAVQKLVEQKFKGLSKKIATETFEGATSSFGDAVANLEDAAGKLAIPKATEWIRTATAGLEKLSAVAEANPGLVKVGATVAGVGAGALVAGGAYVKLKGMVGGAVELLEDMGLKAKSAGDAKRGLAAATDLDSKSEAAKAGVAKKEGGAIMEVTKAALESTEGKKGLTGATKAGVVATATAVAATLNNAAAHGEEKKATEDAAEATEEATEAGEEAEKQSVKGAALAVAQAAATGDLSAAQEELKGQLATFGEERLSEFVDDPKAALAGWKTELGALKTQIRGLPSTIRTAYSSSALANPLSIGGRTFGNVNAFGQGGGSLTMGGAAVSGALGAGAGYLTYNDMQALGYSQGQSAAYAGVTGAVTAGAAAFFPPARLMIAAAEGIGLGVDKLYSERLEKEALTGSGAENADVYGADMQGKLDAAMKSHDREAQAKVYEEMSAKAKESGDETSAERYKLEAQKERNLAAKEGVSGTDEWRAKIQRERSTPAYQANLRANQEKADEQRKAIFNSIGWGDDAPDMGQPAYVQQAVVQRDAGAGLTPQGRAQNTQTVRSDGRRVVTVTQNFIIDEDPRLNAAQQMNDAQFRRAYAG